MKEDYNLIMNSLKIPINKKNFVKPANQVEDEKTNENNSLNDLVSDGKYHILPVFFETISALQKANKDFAIVFRTFGKDLPNIINEFNHYCMNEHPFYVWENDIQSKNLYFSTSTQNKFIIKEDQTGLIYRFNNNVDDICMVLGTMKRFQKVEDINEAYLKEIKEGTVNIVKGRKEIYSKIMELLKKVHFKQF